jgi:stringent starvation protein B
MTQLLPPKKEVALALLERSNVDVYLDPRAKGVVVPPQFRKEPRLILKIGLNMPVPIPDLRLDDDSMSCTLSFNRSPFYCVVPWTSVFAMVGEDGRGMVWPDDVPQELAVKVVEPGEQDPRAGEQDPRASSSTSTAAAPPATARRGETSRRAGAGKAGKRKKKEEGPPRPVLVSVPPVSPVQAVPPAAGARAEAEARSEASGSERPREIRQPPESRRPSNPDGSRIRDGASRPRPAAQPAPPAQGPARPKRELPPYLRVVK